MPTNINFDMTIPLPSASGLVSKDTNNQLALGSDDLLNVPLSPHFFVPDYVNFQVLQNGEGTTTAPGNGWIQHVSKVTNTTYCWGETTINNTTIPQHNTSYQGLDTGTQYLLTGSMLPVKTGDTITTSMGIASGGTIVFSQLNFYPVNYVTI